MARTDSVERFKPYKKALIERLIQKLNKLQMINDSHILALKGRNITRMGIARSVIDRGIARSISPITCQQALKGRNITRMGIARSVIDRGIARSISPITCQQALKGRNI